LSLQRIQLILDHSVIQYERDALQILVLAHVLVGEPDSTLGSSPRAPPGHAPGLSGSNGSPLRVRRAATRTSSAAFVNHGEEHQPTISCQLRIRGIRIETTLDCVTPTN
jgi:hypothetical protein